MTKPDDIPQDVWDAAVATEDAAHVAYGDSLNDPFKSIEDANSAGIECIARAIMAERQKWTKMLAELEGMSLTEVISFDRLTRERSQMAQDWCDFCEAIGVDVDTHDAVAEQILSRMTLVG